MSALEQPPRYNETFSEFEVPSYSSSLQQLQNLPPPIAEEPSLMDAPPHQAPSYAYELRPAPANSLEMTPPPYEHSLTEERVDGQGHMAQNGGNSFNGYQTGEVEDKIKDILSRYNPHAENVPKMEETFPSTPQNQPTRQAQQIPRQQQQPQPQVHAQPVYQAPQQQATQYQPPQQVHAQPVYQDQQQQATQYQPPQQVHAYQPQPEQLRARVVQNVPSQQLQSPPPVQKFQHPVHQQSPPPQMHRPAPQPAQHQQVPQVPQQMPQVPQQPVAQPYPQQPVPQQVMPQQQMPQQAYQQPVQQPQLQQPVGQQMNQTDLSYIQLLQQQAIQFQMQNQQIQQLQSYFDKISSFMERTEKRITSLEATAQGILKHQKEDITNVVSSNEIEVLKKMQHQMESDFDIAKKMQAEFEKEKRKEEKRRSKSSSSSTPSPSSSRSKDKRDSKVSSSSSSMQECPICTLKVPFAELELHVNQCLEGIEKSDTKPDPAVQEKASFWKRVFGPGPKKEKEETSTQIVPVVKPPTGRAALPPPVATSSLGQPPMYPNAQDFYQMPFVYRGGYPQPQMVPYGYPQAQQIYYYPPNMAQPNTQSKK